jgi:hypothetical protein
MGNNPNANNNLTPFQKGELRAREAGSKGGLNKKGTKHLCTIIKDIGDNIDWDKTTLKNNEKMKALYGNSGWKALVYVAFTKALAGDSKAMDWLAKNAFGTKLDITAENIPPIALVKYYEPKDEPAK